jgi:hypothetical protein
VACDPNTVACTEADFQIVAVAAVDRLRRGESGGKLDDLGSGAVVNPVGSGAVNERIVPCAAVERVIAQSAIKRVVSVFTVERVVAAITQKEIWNSAPASRRHVIVAD